MSETSTTAQDASPEARDALWKGRHNILHGAMISYRYHRRRQRFFDLIDKLTKAATVMLGATLLGQWFKEQTPLFASLISGLGLISLVFSYGDRKQAHKELSEGFMDLAGKIEGTPVKLLTDVLVAQWNADVARLSVKEPPTLKTLAMICAHEQAVAEGKGDAFKPPPAHRRLFADIFN